MTIDVLLIASRERKEKRERISSFFSFLMVTQLNLYHYLFLILIFSSFSIIRWASMNAPSYFFIFVNYSVKCNEGIIASVHDVFNQFCKFLRQSWNVWQALTQQDIFWLILHHFQSEINLKLKIVQLFEECMSSVLQYKKCHVFDIWHYFTNILFICFIVLYICRILIFF